jgi:hypothetical protein
MGASISFLFFRALEAVRVGGRRDRGQATTEYVLVLLGVAAIAVALIAWASQSGKVGELLDRVFDNVTDEVS